MQRKVSSSAGQSLRYMAEQRQIRRSRKHKTARTTLLVDSLFDRQQEFGATLRLVDNGGVAEQ